MKRQFSSDLKVYLEGPVRFKAVKVDQFGSMRHSKADRLLQSLGQAPQNRATYSYVRLIAQAVQREISEPLPGNVIPGSMRCDETLFAQCIQPAVDCRSRDTQ